MRQQQFRNKVSESSFTLPFMVMVTLLSCFLQHAFDSFYLWITLMETGILVYVLMEWNSQCQLLRVRSRMISSTVLAFVAAFPALQVSTWCWLPALFLVLSYFIAFKGYGQLKPQGWVFYAFLFVSAGSLMFPPLLLSVPFMWFAFGHQLRILSGKSITASLLGLLFPYWTYGLFCLVSGWNASFWRESWARTLDLRLPDYSEVLPWQWMLFVMLLVLGAIGIVHFIRTSYNDKIRTRQFFYTLLALHFPILFSVVWFPDCASLTLPLLTVNSAPFIAHFFVLARGRSLNFWFLFVLFVLVAVACFNAFGNLLPGMSSLQMPVVQWIHRYIPAWF